uniref:2-hydroxyacid dehydrogenase n=1 Tax=Pararhizobium sp. IMCC3301 TaxID=3067904 RepID=UPI0027412F94|nr:glyoxylate/hydroxypyruvate reductase A [Pararhizobium sp. IMCC3301]
MSILVLMDGWSPAPWATALQSVLPDEQIVIYPDVADRDAVEYALVWAPASGVLNQFPNLKALFSLGAGVDHLLRDASLPDVPIARIVDPDLTGRMSEWVVAQVLLHHRQQLRYLELQREAVWQELAQPAAADVCVGVMGLGELGRDAADILHRLGFALRGWSRTARTVPHVSCFHGADGLDEFLCGTDILLCLLPLTPDTEALIGKSVFDRLCSDGPLGGPVFINAGRGRIQVEADLVAALRSKVLKGASLDVFEGEPLPQDSALWSLDNVIITPHAAAVSSPRALSHLIARQVQAHRAGQTLAHLVDRARGY